MEDIQVLSAQMTRSKEDGYVGRVQFMYKDHPQPYEMTLHSKHRRDWMYSLIFARESGSEEQIVELEDRLEEDDELFDFLVETAQKELADQ